VVVTKVGEIPAYLTDNQNAFLADPDSVSDFADKLRLVLMNEAHAELVGLRGKEVARSVFNYQYQATRILKFLEKE